MNLLYRRNNAERSGWFLCSSMTLGLVLVSCLWVFLHVKLMLFQTGCMNVCTWVSYVVFIQNCTGSTLENDVRSGTHLWGSAKTEVSLSLAASCNLVKLCVSFYVFCSPTLCVYTSHTCADIPLMHSFIGWWFSVVSEEERWLTLPLAPAP